ncbi:MAG TPA: HAMP domain-containing sensor histidine kinase [Actinomycetota bacterium]|nr:HAMP domain-containing sensor histidine kinase [Actinomycetota bacterium]
MASFVLVMTIATLVSVLLVRQVLLAGIDDRIDSELVQESRELQRLAQRGIDPDTGAPFGERVRRILDTFLERNVPARNEALLTFVDGEPYARSRNVLPYRLDEDQELVDRWASITEADAGSVETPGGTVRYLAVPILTRGESRGVFVAAVFRDLEAESIETVTTAAALVGVAALVIGSLLAFVLARRIIRPVQEVEATALTISESDLGNRIEVKGDDEIAHLAQTFNDLLDRLDRAFSAQRAFVDDAGHELRTPITIVRGQLELLSDDPEQRRRAIELATGELDRMSRIVNDLLALAKAQQPELLQFDLVDAGDLTREVAEKAATLGERRWLLDEVADGALVGDRQRLAQALIELMKNALDHTETDDEIAVGSAIADGRARFWVRDTGSGIPPEMRQHVFERFSRARPRRGEGAGLGLSIARAIVEGHGGRIEVESEVGLGSTFTVVVPVDQPPTKAA